MKFANRRADNGTGFLGAEIRYPQVWGLGGVVRFLPGLVVVSVVSHNLHIVRIAFPNAFILFNLSVEITQNALVAHV